MLGLRQFCASMLGGVERLPAPQRDALGVAFGLGAGAAPDRFMVGLAVLGLLSEAAEECLQVCVVDDAQWLNHASAQTLAFVARRLLAERVAMVFAVREGSDVEGLAGLPELAVRGLAEGARALLDAVIQGPMDERVSDRIVAETRGNPPALIELPRGVTSAQLAGGCGLPHSMPLASGIEQSLVARLEALASDTRRFCSRLLPSESLLVTLLCCGARRGRLGIGMAAADRAEAADLIKIGSRVEFRHPLVRSAVDRPASASERREIHRLLVKVVRSGTASDRLEEPAECSRPARLV